MAALSAARLTQSRNLGRKRTYPLGIDIAYAGGIAMIGSDGYVYPAQAHVSNQGCVGVFTATVDNSGGSAGDKNATVQEGEFLFAADTVAQTAVGRKLYADDDQTVDETQASNCPVAGIGTEFVSASQMWIDISMSNSKH